MAPKEPPLGSEEQVMEAVRESNDAPQGLEKDEKAAKAVKASNDAQFAAEAKERGEEKPS